MVTTSTTYPAGLDAAADEAIRTGRPVILDGIAVVPDVLLLEMCAQGHEVPAAPGRRRADGRTVYLFRLPEVVQR